MLFFSTSCGTCFFHMEHNTSLNFATQWLRSQFLLLWDSPFTTANIQSNWFEIYWYLWMGLLSSTAILTRLTVTFIEWKILLNQTGPIELGFSHKWDYHDRWSEIISSNFIEMNRNTKMNKITQLDGIESQVSLTRGTHFFVREFLISPSSWIGLLISSILKKPLFVPIFSCTD